MVRLSILKWTAVRLFGFVGLAMAWIGKGMKEKPEEIVNRLGGMLDGTFAESLEKFRADKRNKN